MQDSFFVSIMEVFVCLIPSVGIDNRIVVSMILLIGPGPVNAAGFAVLEQSVRGLGNAYAGRTAGGEDISTIYYISGWAIRIFGH